MGLRGFERRLERMVEGVFARAFQSGLRPVELGRRLVREMDDHRSVGVRGGTVVPNHFTVALSAGDLEQFEDVQDSLGRELGDAAREHARDEGYAFMGPVEVELVVDERLRTGAFQITGRWPRARRRRRRLLVLPTGDRFTLAERVITIGRQPEWNIVLADPNVSRNHAEIRPQGDGFVVVDLGSTNGSRVNGVRVDSSACRTATRSPSATPACASRPPRTLDARAAAQPPQAVPARAALPLLPPGPAGGVGRGQPARSPVEAPPQAEARPGAPRRTRRGSRKHGPLGPRGSSTRPSSGAAATRSTTRSPSGGPPAARCTSTTPTPASSTPASSSATGQVFVEDLGLHQRHLPQPPARSPARW